MTRALIGFGSNLGDSAHLVRTAAQMLDQRPCRVLRLSPLVSSRAVGGPAGQNDYVNAVALVDTSWNRRQLARRLREIEQRLGRQRTVHWGPRHIDLDLLLDERPPQRSPELTVPHPRMALRPFVLAPAVHVAADFFHGRLEATLAALWDRLQTSPRWIYCHFANEAATAENRLLDRLREALRGRWHLGPAFPEAPSAIPRLAVTCASKSAVAVPAAPVRLGFGPLLPTIEVPDSGWETPVLSDMVALIEGTETRLKWLSD